MTTETYETVRRTTVTRKPGRSKLRLTPAPAANLPPLPRIESPAPAARPSLEIVGEEYAPSGYVLVEGLLPLDIARALCPAFTRPSV